jgi:hypothetical protein
MRRANRPSVVARVRTTAPRYAFVNDTPRDRTERRISQVVSDNFKHVAIRKSSQANALFVEWSVNTERNWRAEQPIPRFASDFAQFTEYRVISNQWRVNCR